MVVKASRKIILEYLAIGFFVALMGLLVLSFTRKGVYSKDLGLNMVVVADEGIALALVRPKEDYLVWIKLPLAMQVKIDGSSAIFPVFSLWKYAEKERGSLDIVAKSVSGTLGVVLPSVVKIEGEITPENLLGSLHFLSLNTNLTARDRVLIRKDLVNLVSTRKTLEVDIPKAALTKKADPDGVEFLEVNSIVNLWTKNRFVFESMLGESANVSVYNLSGVPGKGMQLSKQLESSGVRVVEVESKYDGEVVMGKGCQYKAGTEYLYTEYLLERFMKCKKLPSDNKVKGEGIEVWLF